MTHVIIRGRRWQLVFERSPRCAGSLCDGFCEPPGYKGKRIVIKANMPPRRELDTIIHELLHAACWDLDEECISETATDIARVLDSLGYRRTF